MVADVYRSGWLSMGPRTAEFERALAEYTGARHALAVANGTTALHLICLAAELGPGDEVIVPSLTFVATVNAIAYTGATPRFVDIAALERPWPSAADVEAAITPRTKAIMTMAYGGHPGDIAAIRDARRRPRPRPARGRRPRHRRTRAGPPRRHLRRRGRVLVLLEQEPGGRRGRRGRHRRRRARGADQAPALARHDHAHVGPPPRPRRRLRRRRARVQLPHRRAARRAADRPPGAPGRRERSPARARRPLPRAPARRRRPHRRSGAAHLHGARRRPRPRARRPAGARHPDEPALPARAPLRDLRRPAGPLDDVPWSTDGWP